MTRGGVVVLWLIFLPAIVFGVALVVASMRNAGPLPLVFAAVIFIFYGSVLVKTTMRWRNERRGGGPHELR